MPLRFVLLLAVLVSSTQGLAQGLPDARGSLVGNAQAAAVDDATALMVNPAGLANIQGLELQSGWLTRIGAVLDQHGDATVVVTGPLGLVAGGLGLQLVGTQTPRLRASIGTATALDRSLLIGGTLHSVSKVGTGSSEVFGDVGVQLRCSRFMGLGLVVENMGSSAGSSLRAGVSVRPVGEYLTLGVDTRFIPSTGALIASIGNGTVVPALSARLGLGGFALTAGAQLENLGAQALAPLAVEATASVEFNLDHVGATVFGGIDGLGVDGQRGVFGARSRASTAAWPSLLPASGRWLFLELSGAGEQARKKGNVIEELFVESPSPTRILAALDNAADDPSIEGLVLRFSGLELGWGRATELRAAILRVRAAGKKVVVHLDGGGDIDFFMASAADQIWLTPSGSVGLDGLRRDGVRRLDLEKTGHRGRGRVRGSLQKCAAHVHPRRAFCRRTRSRQRSTRGRVYDADHRRCRRSQAQRGRGARHHRPGWTHGPRSPGKKGRRRAGVCRRNPRTGRQAGRTRW